MSLLSSTFEDSPKTVFGDRDIWAIAARVAFPDFVKRASQEELTLEDTNPDLYADRAKRQLPVHTPAATWLSVARFLHHKQAFANPEGIAENLRRAAEFHKIAGAIRPILQEYLGESHEELVNQEEYPIRNPREVKAACDWYFLHRDQMLRENRKRFALKITKAADDFGVNLQEKRAALESACGRGTAAAKDVAELLMNRVLAAQKPGGGYLNSSVVEGMLKLAKLYLATPATACSPERLEKTAELLDRFDRENGINQYSDKFPRPEDCLFGITKEAKSLFADLIETKSGQLYEKIALEKLRVCDIRDCLGDEYAEALTEDGIHVSSEKLAAVLPTMPKDDADLFDSLCKRKEIRPKMTTKAAAEIRIPQQEIAAVLAKYSR